MCRSTAEGGQRCYGHAHTRFTTANRRLAAARTGQDPTSLALAEARWEENAVALASTPEGHTEVLDWAAQAATRHDYATEARLRDIARRGQTLRTVQAIPGRRSPAHPSGHTPSSTRLLDRSLTAPTAEERSLAWATLTRTPLSTWTPADRLTLAERLEDVPGTWVTRLDYWKRLRAHGRAHPEEQDALKAPLGRYRARWEPILNGTPR